ncbi:hypothetical protein, partial [Bacillus pumilus]|uniref:ATP-binding protein n=1 Tax=Bacillus pumilus TaxID=1408 RepID=UPI0021B2E62E
MDKVEEGMGFRKEMGLGVIVRGGYRLGGRGGGICRKEEEVKEMVEKGLKVSGVRQCLVEKSIGG